MNHCILFGYPGSGKGTISRILTSYGYHAIGLGNILRIKAQQKTPLSRKIKYHIDNGLLLPDELINNIAQNEISNYLKKTHTLEHPFVLEGYPNTLPQFYALQKFVHDLGIDEKTQFIYLKISESLAISRIISRLTCRICAGIYNERNYPPKIEGFCDYCFGALQKRPEDNEACALHRITQFKQKTAVIIKHLQKNKKIVTLDASQKSKVLFNVLFKEGGIYLC